jgi:hypothetical protein
VIKTALPCPANQELPKDREQQVEALFELTGKVVSGSDAGISELNEEQVEEVRWLQGLWCALSPPAQSMNPFIRAPLPRRWSAWTLRLVS